MEAPHLASGPALGQGSSVRIELLGDLRVTRAGRVLPLPASKRTRALLGYLAATGVSHTRQALCDLLWDGPDDPRAELRWCLSKLRPVLADERTQRIRADRERVAFAAEGASVDISEVQALLAGNIAGAGVAALEHAAALLAGEFLDGLDLPACYRFHQWCMAERESYGALRFKVHAALLDRLSAEPERALVYARAMVAADPLSEPANAALVRVLARLGRAQDGLAHCRQANALFQRELGVAPGRELLAAQRELRTACVERPASPAIEPDVAAPDATQVSAVSAPLVGRTAERNMIEAAVSALARPGLRKLLLFVGESGIGKTRLLEVLAERAQAGGCRVLQARCFEAEMVRPYGAWIDALRTLPVTLMPESLRQDLAALLPPQGTGPSDSGDRARLFAAAAALLQGVAASQALVLILDDLQWLDEGSSALLHFLARGADTGGRILFAGAARPGEIDDNPWARRLLQSLAREQRVSQCALAPLDAGEAAALLASTASSIDPESAHRESGGNPLFLLALARAQPVGSAAAGLSLDALTAEQVQRLDDATREVVIWAAAIGREFRVETLSAALGVSEVELLVRLERLERRALLKPTGEGRYDFAHDLVRSAVYRSVSQPRRRAIHRQIARVLVDAAAVDASLHGELVHHASQAGDHATTVRACIAAGEHCLRVFANAQAAASAELGLARLPELPAAAARAEAHIELLKIRVFAMPAPAAARLPQVLGEIQHAVEAAEWLGLHAAAATGAHLLSWLTQKANDTQRARAATLRAERLSRAADDTTRCQQLANTARCLLEVEADVPQARVLLDEASTLAEALKLHAVELEWGHGLIARWDGDLETAYASLRRAIGLARLREDRWREFEGLVWLATIEFERSRFDAVAALCDEIEAVARLADANAPMAEVLRALAAAAQGSDDAARSLQQGLAALRAHDDKAHLAYALNHAATLNLAQARFHHAAEAATEALGAAEALGRSTEMAVAHALLARIACKRGRRDDAAAWLAPWHPAGAPAQALSMRALSHLREAVQSLASCDGSNADSNDGATDCPPQANPQPLT